jgi:hypothetical protein
MMSARRSSEPRPGRVIHRDQWEVEGIDSPGDGWVRHTSLRWAAGDRRQGPPTFFQTEGDSVASCPAGPIGRCTGRGSVPRRAPAA